MSDQQPFSLFHGPGEGYVVEIDPDDNSAYFIREGLGWTVVNTLNNGQNPAEVQHIFSVMNGAPRRKMEGTTC